MSTFLRASTSSRHRKKGLDEPQTDVDNGFSMIETIIVVTVTLVLTGVGFYWMLSGANDADDHVRETSEMIVENNRVSDDFSEAIRNAVAINISSGASYGRLMTESGTGQCRTWTSVETESAYSYLAYFEGESAENINGNTNMNNNTFVRNAINNDNTDSLYYPQEYYPDYAPATWGNHFQVVNNDAQNGVLVDFVNYRDREQIFSISAKPRTTLSEESDCW